MAETYPGNTDSQGASQLAPKKGLSGWVIALIVVVVLLFICCICAVVALILAGPSVGNVFSTVIGTIEAMTPAP